MSASRTALLVAAWRAMATEAPDPVCHDPWAAQLCGAEGRAMAMDYESRFPHMPLWLSIRTEFIDRQLRRLADGPSPIQQVVVLGAGLDTRAARLGRDALRFFEVDQPDSQADKLARIERLPDYPKQAATYVECDFEADDFLDRLVSHGFVPEMATLFIWEGVVYYLTQEAVRATLGRISAGCEASSVVVFDYIGKRAVRPDADSESVQRMREMVTRFDEPLRFGMNDPVPLLHGCGYRHLRTVSFDEVCLSYTGSYQRSREFRFQSMALASVGREALP